MRALLVCALLLAACPSPMTATDAGGAPPDLAGPADLTTDRDLSTPLDLPAAADLASTDASPSDLAGADAAAASDAAAPSDAAHPPDQAEPPDLLPVEPPFWASGSAGALVLVAGQSAGYTVTLTREAGFVDAVTVTLEGLPTSVQVAPMAVTLSGSQLSAQFVLSASSLALPSGPHAVQARLVSGSFERTVALSLSVVVPDFTVTATPSTLHFLAGGSADLLIEVSRLHGFAEDVTVSFVDLPPVLHATGATLTVSDPSKVFTLTADDQDLYYEGTFVVRTTAGTRVHDYPVAYTLAMRTDFTLAANPAALSLSRGTSVTLFAQIARLNLFSGSVTVTLSGLPPGVTASPSPLVIQSGELSGVLSLSADPSASEGGPTTVTLTGSGLGNGVPRTHTATLALTIAPAPSFNLSVAPTATTLAQGGSTTLDLTVARDSGFAEPLSTTLQTLPSGVTAQGGSFGATDLTSTVTLTAAADARLLIPTSATVSTASAGAARTRPVTVTVTPAANPALDTSFGTGGALLLDDQGAEAVLDLRVFGSSRARLLTSRRAVRLLPTGQLDTTFGTGGYAERPLVPGSIVGGYISNGGDFYLFGRGGPSYGITYVGKTLATGGLDAAFGTDSVATIDVPTFYPIGLRATPSGQVLVYGSIGSPSTQAQDFAVVRLTSAGVIDQAFGSGGVARFDLTGIDQVQAVVPTALGRFWLIGSATNAAGMAGSPLALCRMTASGALDTSFDADGCALLSHGLGSQLFPRQATELSTGALIVVGSGAVFQPMASEFLAVSRILPSGGTNGSASFDPSFGTEGTARLTGTLFDLRDVERIALDAADRMLIVGSHGFAPLGFSLARLTSAALPDTKFGSAGLVRLRGGSSELEVINVVDIDPATGYYWVFGRLGPRLALARYVP